MYRHEPTTTGEPYAHRFTTTEGTDLVWVPNTMHVHTDADVYPCPGCGMVLTPNVEHPCSYLKTTVLLHG